MKKKEIIRQNQEKKKLKSTGDFKWLRYASYMCVAMVVLFLVYTGMLSTANPEGMAALFEGNLFVTVGFVVCAANLFIWNVLKTIIKNLEEFKNIDAAKVKLIIIAVAELVLFNYATMALVCIGLYSYFNWKRGFRDIFDDIKQNGQLKEIIALLVVLVILIFLTYFIAMAAMIK